MTRTINPHVAVFRSTLNLFLRIPKMSKQAAVTAPTPISNPNKATWIPIIPD